jgi:putative membrane protein
VSTESSANPIEGDDIRSLYRRPFAWIGFSWLLLLIPAIGFLVEADMPWERLHPAINALLNATSALFLVCGYAAIRRRQPVLHRQCMIAALTSSALFLLSYVVRFAMSGSHRYPGAGWDKVLYLGILFSHMALAILIAPLALRVLYLAWKRRFPEHRRLARWAWPIWMYVSLTGVLVYLMLYPIAEHVYR